MSAREAGGLDLSEIRGQEGAKRAMEVALAGGHHLLLTGPGGCGKSVLGNATGRLLPEPSVSLWKEIAWTHGRCGVALPAGGPFRAPDPSTPRAAMVGSERSGGAGEASLAHGGVLFLDDAATFRRDALHGLGRGMDRGTLGRSSADPRRVRPAEFILVATAGTCPRVERRTTTARCRSCGCHRRIPESLLRHVQIVCDMAAASSGLGETRARESAGEVRQRVVAARAIQQERQRGRLNAHLTLEELRQDGFASEAAEHLVRRCEEEMRLGVGGVLKMLRVARTIADLAGARRIGAPHAAEAGSYQLSREPLDSPGETSPAS